MGAFFLVLKSFFGGFVTKVLGDWRLLLAVVIISIAMMVGWKIRKLENHLADAQQQVQVEQKNNETLRGNVDTLQTVNSQNQAIIDQLTADKKAAMQGVANLSLEIGKTNKALGTIQQKIETIKVPPTQLTPYISEAIDGIQQERDAAAGATK